jgi:hypothetical protein
VVAFLDILAKLETRELRAFIEASEKAFAESLEVFAQYVADQAKGMTPEMQEQYHDFTSGEAFSLAERFPRFGRHMAFVGTFGYFENTLLGVCDRVGRILTIGFHVKDLKGSGIEVAKKYLTKGAKIVEPFEGQHWERIVVYGKVRNLILHSQSQVLGYSSNADIENKPREDFAKIVKATHPIEIDVLGQFTLSKEYCVSAIETVERFFDELYPLLPQSGKISS